MGHGLNVTARGLFLAGALMLSGCASPGPDAYLAEQKRVDAIAQRVVQANYPECAKGERPADASSLVCHATVTVTYGAEANAYLKATRIRITTGMIRFASSDDELAFVIAHELGHVALGHTSGGIRGRSRHELELEADRIAVRLLDKAGFSKHAGSRILARMGRSFPRLEAQAHETHPSFSNRASRLTPTYQATVGSPEEKKSEQTVQ